MKHSIPVLGLEVILLCAFSLACSSHSGLQAYHGRERPEHEIAVLDTKQDATLRHSYRPFIRGVDEFAERTHDGDSILSVYRATLLPGEHTVAAFMGTFVQPSFPDQSILDKLAIVDKTMDRANSLIWNAGKSLITGQTTLFNFGQASYRSVSFTAKAGHKYVIRGDVDIPETWLWIEDASTGELMGGTKRPESESCAPDVAAGGDVALIRVTQVGNLDWLRPDNPVPLSQSYGFEIVRIDGRRLEEWREEVAVTPGPHTLEVYFYYSGARSGPPAHNGWDKFWGPFIIAIDAQAGSTYTISGDQLSYEVIEEGYPD